MKISTSGFGPYDIRGVYPESINQELAYRVGRIFPKLFDVKKVGVGNDIRLSSPTIRDALERGLTESGCDVLDIGQCGTEMIYYTVGSMNLDGGIMVTASHNPQDHNGLKCVGRGVKPIGPDSGLYDIRDKIIDESLDWSPKKATGKITKIDILPGYIQKILSYIDVKNLKPLKIVVNSGNGSAGPVINELEKFLPFEIVKIHNDPNGFFPNGVPNPLMQEKRSETIKAVIENKADCGIAFDGDFDRCFLFDERGNFVEGYYMVGLLAEAFMKKEKNAKVVCDARVFWNTEEIAENAGGKALVCQSGHTFIKEMMRRENAIYGGELSAHHYFRDFYFCDSGMISWLLSLEMISMTGKNLSELVADMQEKYPISGEVNTKVESVEKVKEIFKKIEDKYSGTGKVLKIDGFGVDYENWRFNVRGSQTEPYVRLNVETRGDKKLLEEKTTELLKVIRS